MATVEVTGVEDTCGNKYFSGSLWRVFGPLGGVRIVAWAWSETDRRTRQADAVRPDLVAFCGNRWANYNLPAGTDLGPHESFCRGEMPAAVYADWLAEQGVPLPAAVYDLLRGW